MNNVKDINFYTKSLVSIASIGIDDQNNYIQFYKSCERTLWVLASMIKIIIYNSMRL